MPDSIARLSPFSPKSLGYEYKDYLKKYITFSGKATRRQFWSIFVINLLLSLLFNLLPHGLITFRLLTFLPELSLYTRRFHDMGLSGKKFALTLSPLILGAVIFLYQPLALIFIIIYTLLLYIMAATAPGTETNKDDKEHKTLYIGTAIIFTLIPCAFLITNLIKNINLTQRVISKEINYSYIMDATLISPIFKQFPQNFPQDLKERVLNKGKTDNAMKKLIEIGEIELRPQGTELQIIFNNLNQELCELTLNYRGRYKLTEAIGNDEPFTEGMLNGTDFVNGCTCEKETCSAALTFSR